MSFGFSVGDFLATGRLVRDIVTILRTSARAEYQELILELHGLERALEQIERLKAPTGQEYAVNSIKVAALMCTHVLDEFAGKLKKFEVFSNEQIKAGKFSIWKEKLRWGFTMADEVRDLRAYLAAHVGSLNMRLVTEGLSVSYIVSERVQATSNNSDGQTEALKAVLRSIQTTLQKVAGVLTGEVVPQIKALTQQVSRVWQTNTQIMSILVRMQEAPVPALQYTWFQAPVKFEDALGRVFPIPSEFDWSKIQAIIEVHFANGPGRQKIAAGEYELFDPLNRQEVMSESSFGGLRPGMSLTLAFVIGKYQDAMQHSGRCPRPGCRSQSIRIQHGGAKECMGCGVCFEDARISLPMPYRTDTFATVPSQMGETSPLGKRKRILSGPEDSQSYRQARAERMKFKNIRISYMPLPPTPKTRNIRRIPNAVRATTGQRRSVGRSARREILSTSGSERVQGGVSSGNDVETPLEVVEAVGDRGIPQEVHTETSSTSNHWRPVVSRACPEEWLKGMENKVFVLEKVSHNGNEEKCQPHAQVQQKKTKFHVDNEDTWPWYTTSEEPLEVPRYMSDSEPGELWNKAQQECLLQELGSFTPAIDSA